MDTSNVQLTRWRMNLNEEKMENSVFVKLLINDYLLGMLGKEELVEEWWHRYNKNWNDKTPHSIYESGPEGRKEVYYYVMKCSEGGW